MAKGSTRPLLIFLLFLLLSAAAATGISIAVVEWRSDSADLRPVEERLAHLATEVRSLRDEVQLLGTGLPPITSPAPTPFSTTPPPSSPQTGASRDDPVPKGDSLVLPSGWELTVVGFTPHRVGGFAPPSDRNVAVVRVRVSNVSAGDPANPRDIGFALIGADGVVYEAEFGFGGADIDRFTLILAGSAEGDVPFTVRLDESSLVLMTGQGEARRFFAVE